MTDKQDPIAHAARLLREAAEELRQAHTYHRSEGWQGETGAQSAHDVYMAAAQALEDWEEAIGAGGVSGPLVGQPQAMPDWVQYEETSDVLIVHGKRYAAGIFGKAGFLGPPGTLLRVECGDADCVTLARVPPSANAGEPRALNPRHIRKFLQALQAGEMSVSRAVEILDAWVGGYYEDEMVPLPPPDSCLIADDEFPMEIVRKLRSELAAAPPTAQAEGWRPIETAPKDCQAILVTEGRFCHCVEWNEEFDWWAVDDNKLGPFRLRGSSPTHWMPLPPPPTSAEGVEHG